jgi:hypothetical protein
MIALAMMSLFALCLRPSDAQMVTGRHMTNFNSAFGLPNSPVDAAKTLTVQIVSSTVPANILWPGDKPQFTFSVANHTATAESLTAHVDIIAYGTKGTPGDVWTPIVYKIGDEDSAPVSIAVDAGATQTVTVRPAIPERFGAYALIVDLGRVGGRQFLVSCVRTFAASPRRIQYSALSLDDLGPDVLGRLGVHAIRWGISYKPTTDPDFEQWYQDQCKELSKLQAKNVTVLAMFGAGAENGPTQPLGRGRPHLDAAGNMLDTKLDLAWLPSYDSDFTKFVARLCKDYGWPKGPITACSLWNEPWEGISISGWGADMLRYRDLYTSMASGVIDARADGRDILTGGCDSSSNALDKLFPDGKDTFLSNFDFLSVHYQGMCSFATYKPWVNRVSPRGRVRIWDTESWVANTDDRVAAVVAANRSAGYDRAMGIFGGNISDADPHQSGGENAWSVAAAVGAATHFIGDRPFNRLLFQNGLPWVMVFDGQNNDPEDGTVVVVGDLGEEFGPDNILFRTARGLQETTNDEKLREQLVALSGAGKADAGVDANGKQIDERQLLTNEINAEHTLTGASMSINSSSGKFSLYDFYGNKLPSEDGKIVVPLDGRGFFLRGNGNPGDFDKLLSAVKTSKIEGIEPLATEAHDLTAPVEADPTLTLTLTNVLNRPVIGMLEVKLGQLQLENPRRKLSLQGNETSDVSFKVIGGAPDASNTYPLTMNFNAGKDGFAIHHEDMHANVISHRTIVVDGDLSDWNGVLPQPVFAPGTTKPSLTEAAWFPFNKFTAGTGVGVATGYLAYDDKYFYFAAKIAESAPDEGTLRFATRDDDSYFYPDVSYDNSGANKGAQLTWPADVRHYSYRADPVLPSGNSPDFDNVQIAFNVLPQAQKKFYASPPGTMPDYTISSGTDYEYALNKVAAQYGGGTEIWRLRAPTMPLKHFYPRQPKSPEDGPVVGGKLVVKNLEGMRIVEAAIPWSEIPEVQEAMEQHRAVKFSYRVNDKAGVGCMELSRGRSVAKHGQSFHADWLEHWENQVQFGWGN